jgi:choline dehydrogenase
VIADFDCVIVSAGAVGSVLANRLSEDPDNRVLLLEYGGRDTSPMVSLPERLCDLDMANSSPAWMRSFGLGPQSIM